MTGILEPQIKQSKFKLTSKMVHCNKKYAPNTCLEKTKKVITINIIIYLKHKMVNLAHYGPQLPPTAT